MRTPLSVLGVCLAALVAGCSQAAARAPDAAPALPAPAPPGASAAGGACRWLDFDVIANTLGLRFDVAVATEHETKARKTERQRPGAVTQTCVLQAATASRPDLLLTISPTKADAAIFAEMLRPDPAKPVKDLGEAAYRVGVKAGKDHGPGAEVGWLTADGRVVVLRCLLARGAAKATARALEGKLVTLAKRVDAPRE